MPRLTRLIVAIAVVALSLAGAGSALAQGPITPQHSDPAWQGSYWNNMSFSGAPALQRADADINFDWGTGSPDGAVAADHFSARWTRYIDVAGGVYRFTATSDDGIRVWIDGQPVIDQWSVHSAWTFNVDVTLTAGHHLVTVEYYENDGLAMAKVAWGPTGQTINNWRGEYYNNTGLSGSPALVRDDAQVNFDWGTGSPAPGVIGSDAFSVRWTRTLNLPAANYHFTVNVDDGVRLWVNGHLLIDSWTVQSIHTYTGDLYLSGGNTDVKMEYFENDGLALAQLNWSTGVTPPPPSSGEIVVDDLSAGFVRGGTATAWSAANEGYGGHEYWTRNDDWARSGYNWARWYPSQLGLTAGRYEVYVFIPERYTTTANANYWVSHAGGYTRRIVNQSATGSQWVSLGTYSFNGNMNDYVSLSDVTGEYYISTLIGFDAVKFVRR